MRTSDDQSARFLTFSCLGHSDLLAPSWAKDVFVDQLALARDRYGLRIFAWSVMQDHVHLLLRHDEAASSIRTAVTALKSRSSRLILAAYSEEAAPSHAVKSALAKRALWERGGGHDRSIYSRLEFEQKLHYVVMNPVKAGLSLTPEEYPWCSVGSSVLPSDSWWD